MTKEELLAPDVGLLAKLGSIVGHIEEGLSSTGHVFDEVALKGLLEDPEVKEWMTGMRGLALVPEPR